MKKIIGFRKRNIEKRKDEPPICQINRYVWMLFGGILTLLLLKALGW